MAVSFPLKASQGRDGNAPPQRVFPAGSGERSEVGTAVVFRRDGAVIRAFGAVFW